MYLKYEDITTSYKIRSRQHKLYINIKSLNKYIIRKNSTSLVIKCHFIYHLTVYKIDNCIRLYYVVVHI